MIEVYSQSDKERLKNIVNNVNWSLFITNDTKSINSSLTDSAASDIQFSDNKTQEYEELIAASLAETSSGKNNIITTDDGDEIDVDDI